LLVLLERDLVGVELPSERGPQLVGVADVLLPPFLQLDKRQLLERSRRREAAADVALRPRHARDGETGDEHAVFRAGEVERRRIERLAPASLREPLLDRLEARQEAHADET